MRLENKYKTDLEYLSDLGYEKIAVNNSDFKDLEKRIRAGRFSLKRFYVGAASLAIGVVIGAFLFSRSGIEMEEHSSPKPATKQPSTGNNQAELTEKALPEEDIPISKENFVNPATVIDAKQEPTEGQLSPKSVSAEVLSSKPLDLSLLNNGEIEEKQLKYMSNSPVFYLHHLKITNYTTLYFKKQRFVKFNGLSAAYANKNETGTAGNNLKQEPEYYLHEEIARAMLYFKNEKYDQAIQSLKTVSTYNKEDLNCDFYLAMSYYYKKNYGAAIELYDRCIQNINNTFLEEAMYYKALSLFENGDKEQAKGLLDKIAEAGGFYAAKADAVLNK